MFKPHIVGFLSYALFLGRAPSVARLLNIR